MKAWRRPPGFFLPNVFAFEHDRKAFIDWSSPYAASGWLKRAVALANLGHFEQSSPRSRFESVLDEFRLDRTSCRAIRSSHPCCRTLAREPRIRKDTGNP